MLLNCLYLVFIHILFINLDQSSKTTAFCRRINIFRFHLKCQLLIESILVTSLQPVRHDEHGEDGSNFDIGSVHGCGTSGKILAQIGTLYTYVNYAQARPSEDLGGAMLLNFCSDYQDVPLMFEKRPPYSQCL